MTSDPTYKLRRRLAAMQDISRVLGRLLEFLTLKLDGGFFLRSPLNLARTAETLAFVLSQGLACTPTIADLNATFVRTYNCRAEPLVLSNLLAPFIGV